MQLPKSKHKLGYTQSEIQKILKQLTIPEELFWKKFGINTGAMSKKGEFLYYGCDITLAITCCQEGRDKQFCEWD